MASKRALTHKQAIFNEIRRREEAQKAEIKRQIEVERATKLRKQNRANLRERIRIKTLEDTLVNNVIIPAPLQDWSLKMPIMDVRDYINEDVTNYLSVQSGSTAKDRA